MNANSTLSYAIAAILSASAVRAAQVVPADTAGDSEGIQEITVTAQRRTENMQDVPITIQALTSDTLTKLNVSTFDDFVKYLPNVTQSGNGPGQSSIYMRGLSVNSGATQGSGSVGQIPNVAVYLDDQAASLPGRNLDVYAADLERIEVLEGPQGTLYGSGAQAGVLRYITNKPVLNVTQGIVNGGYSYTAHGEPNSNVDATLNVPLIADTLAVRAVIYNDSRGGYINNVPSTFTRLASDEGITLFNGGVLPTDSVAINNNNLVGKAINPVTYRGFRLSGLYKINNDWDVLLTQSYQDIDAQGVFYQMPFGSEGTTFDAKGKPIGSTPLPHLSVNLFNPASDRDNFENTALTVNGLIGALKAVYSGGYLVRSVEQVGDYTNYARGVYASYYQCAGLTPGTASGICYSPSTTWRDTEKNTHQSHEIRLSTPDDRRLRAVGGVYYEQFVITDDVEYQLRTVPTCSPAIDVNCFSAIQPYPGAFTTNSDVRNDNTSAFFNFQRTIDQKAAFGSVDFDLVPRTLTLTAGTRYYRFDEKAVGANVFSFGCANFVPTTDFGPCTNFAAGTDVGRQNPNHSKYSGFKSRANISWKITDDVMVYYTWSQGFRPGGFNLGTFGHLPGADGRPQYISPAVYAPDSLTNNEIGWKTLLFNRRLQIDGAAYQENWNNTQINFFDPQDGLGNLIFATNGPNYRVRGVEVQVVARVTDGLSVQGASSYNTGRQTNSPALTDNNPQSASFGQPIAGVVNAYGASGSRLANAPQLQWNVRVRDDIPVGDYKAFWQISALHVGDSQSATGNIVSFDQPGYTTYDAAVGISRDAWQVQLYGQNLTSVNASTGTNAAQFVEAQTVTRPRVAGIKIGYHF